MKPTKKKAAKKVLGPWVAVFGPMGNVWARYDGIIVKGVLGPSYGHEGFFDCFVSRDNDVLESQPISKFRSLEQAKIDVDLYFTKLGWTLT